MCLCLLSFDFDFHYYTPSLSLSPPLLPSHLNPFYLVSGRENKKTQSSNLTPSMHMYLITLALISPTHPNTNARKIPSHHTLPLSSFYSNCTPLSPIAPHNLPPHFLSILPLQPHWQTLRYLNHQLPNLPCVLLAPKRSLIPAQTLFVPAIH